MKKPRYTTIQCSGCGTCCTLPIVPVTDSDLRRLVKATGKAVSSLVKFYTPAEMEFDRDAEVWIKFNYGKRAMGLRRKNDKCMFLDDNNRCTVYSARPMTCRTFPYIVEYDDDGNIEVSLNDIVSCKCTKVPDSDLNSLIGDTVTEDQEDGEYFDKIDTWNMQQKAGGTGEFLTWCKL